MLNLLPSPQISVQISLVEAEPPDHDHPVSFVQVELHPSLSTTFPSSQYVLFELNRLPSPHISEQVSLVDEEPPVQDHPDSI